MDDQDKRIEPFYVAASGIISDEPGWLYSLIFTGLSAGQNLITVYDGQGTAGQVRIILQSIQYDTVPVVLNKPWRFSKGLYVAITTGSGHISGQFLVKTK